MKIRCETLDSQSFKKARKSARKAAATVGFEICGALIRRANGEIHMSLLPNLATEPAKWEIRTNWLRQIRAALKKGGNSKLVGTFHSHVGGYAYPSTKDLDYYPSGSLMMIYDTVDDRVGLWRPLVRNGRGRLIPLAVVCESPRWQNAKAISYALYLMKLFKVKAKRNRPK